MRHVRLGRAGLPVSRLCFGTMTFGLQCDEPSLVAILERAAAGGIAFLAVARVLAHPAVTAPIIGASRPELLDDVLLAAEAGLPADLQAKLDELTRKYRGGDDPR